MSAPDQSCPRHPQLLYVGQQDTSRLLEVYVKRSLSLNDGQSNDRQVGGKQRKWVTVSERNKRDRLYSSDTSVHLSADKKELQNGVFRPVHDDPELPSEPQTDQRTGNQKKSTLKTRWMSFRDKGRRPSKLSKTVNPTPPEPEPTTAVSDLESSTEKKEKEEEKRGREKKRKLKKKKPKISFWKSIVSFFSRGDTDTDERDPSPVKAMSPPRVPVDAGSPPVTCMPIPRPFPGEEVSLRLRKSTKKRHSRKRLSLKLDRPSSLNVAVVEVVKPTDSYYENVSEELKKIVTEVMDSPTTEDTVFAPELPPSDTDTPSLSTEEVTERLIALIKQQGDFLDAKMKESPSMINFFQGLTYGSFQQLADQYVQSEIPTQPVEDQVVAPELVKLAFTLDFTARVASLSRQSPNHIMGLGSRYLQDRFTYASPTEPDPGQVHGTT